MKKIDNQDCMDIWGQIRTGSRPAFNKLFNAYIQILFDYGCKFTTDEQLVEDCIQELFVDLWRKRTQIQINHSIKHYLLLSLRRLLFRRLKSLRSRKQEPIEGIEAEMFDLELSIEEHWIARQLVEIQKNKLAQAIQQLSTRQKEAIFLRYYQEMKYEEIAVMMAISVAAVYKLVSVGVKQLRKRLGKGALGL